MSRVATENGPISRGSQSRVSVVRDLWWKGFTKKVSFSLEWESDEVMDGESGEEKDGWDKHGEMKLVHKMKLEVGSWDEAR